MEGGSSASRVASRPLSGRAIFPGSLATQASADEAANDASVALIEPSTGRTVVGGRTNASGAFTLMPDGAFTPEDETYYRLEVGRRLGGSSAVGQNQVSMATVVKWTSGLGWSSITSSEIVLNATTTALVLIEAEDGTLNFADVMGKVSGPPGYASVAPINGHEVAARVTEVTAKLLADQDPLGDLPIVPPGNMAPGDTGDVKKHHDYVLTKNGQASVFVWIPVFAAYQLKNVGSCGVENAGKPVGYWVRNKPSSGTEGTDWFKETFGGFYAGKYEASHNDANGTGTQGTSPYLKVQQGVAPWTNVDWNAASYACLTFDPHCRLMGDDQWTALAVWSMIHGVMPYGNSKRGQDNDVLDITFTDDPSDPNGSSNRALTGTGTRSVWVGTTNRTTHTGKTDGVYDLHGNVWEWTGTLGNEGDNVSNGYYTINDARVGMPIPAGNYVTSLDTSALLRRYGMPGTTGPSGEPLFGMDYFWGDPSSNAKCIRGGCWLDGQGAGIWRAFLNNSRLYANYDLGFRPVLVY